MAGDREQEYRGWRVVEGPGSESTDDPNASPPDQDLGQEPVLGAGYGASTGGVPGTSPPGPALNELPEHTGPNAIAGVDLYISPLDEEERTD